MAAKKFQWLKQLGLSLIAIAVGVYLVMQLSLSVGNDVDLEYSTYTTVRATTEMSAYIFRDEQLIPREGGGTVCYCVEDGVKVHGGETVALVYSEATDASIQQRIQEIDSRIDILTRSSVSDGTTTSDITIISRRIEELRLQYLKSVEEGNLEKALRLKDDLLVQLNRSRALSQKIDSYDAQIHALAKEKAQLEQSLTGECVTVASPASGYYYAAADGYESDFTMSVLDSMTVAGFDALAASTPDSAAIAASAGKLVRSATWYILCRSDKRSAAGYTAGDSVKAIFPYASGTELTVTFERRLVQTDTDECLLLFSCNVNPEGFAYTRSQTVEIVGKSYEGLRISTQALRKNGDKTGVYVLDGNVVLFKTANILCRYNGYYICDIPTDPDYPSRHDKSYISQTQLSLYDAVIVSGTGIYEGALIQ